MKRILTVLFSTLFATAIYAQTPYLEYYGTPSFLLSHYHDCHEPGVLKMQSSANLVIDNNNDPSVVKIRKIASAAHLVIDDIFTKVDGETEDATFEIKADPDSVYDYGYKIYSAQFADCKIKYVTYCLADELSVVLNDKEYVLSCLDGGMDIHIKYLYHQYFSRSDGEKLCIQVMEDLPLEAADKSKILLKKGSSFSFDIIDTRRQ